MTLPFSSTTPVTSLTIRQRYELLRAQLQSERSSFISHWKDLTDYIQPRRGRFVITDNNRGDRRNQKIIDSTGTIASRTLSSGMMSGVTSPARPWFRLTTSDQTLADKAAVKQWLFDVTRYMQTVFLRSNLYNVLPTLYTDMGVFATSAMAVLEDDDTIIRCQSFPIGSYFLANDEKGRVRIFMRDYQMTVRQMVSRFGKDKCSLPVQMNFDRGNYELKYDVTHVVGPNMDYDSEKQSLQSKDLPFSSCYYERGTNQNPISWQYQGVLEEKGFHEFPVLAPRWEVTAEDVYGTNCPGMTALGDIKQLQLSEKLKLKAINKSIDPPLVGPQSLRGNRVSILPGDITYNDAEPNKGLRPIHDTKTSIADLENSEGLTRQRIDRAFFADLFLMLTYSDPSRGAQPPTAREIDERHEEKLLALGPVLEQLNQDLLDPLIDRTFNIMHRRGLLPPIPQELHNQPLRVEYISIMAQAQKMVGLSGLERLSNFILPIAQIDPSILDKINRDEMVDQYADSAGVPPSVIATDEQVQGVRDARAKAQQQQQQAEQLALQSKSAKDLAAAPTDGKNALTDATAPVGGIQGLLQMAAKQNQDNGGAPV